jgi:two-component system phosphate regulon sensor histidine kinase PhoR
MPQQRPPHFHEYIVTRILSIFSLIFTIVVALVWGLDITQEQALYITTLFIVSFGTFVYLIHRYTLRIEKELKQINRYLKEVDNLERIDERANFFAKEFIDINKNLYKALKKFHDKADVKQRYNAKLKLKNRQRTDMLHAIAHEFRNPIAAIMGYAQTLQDESTIPKALQKKFLKKIYTNSLKIESLLERLILWNKFESNEANLQKTEFNLFILAATIVESLQHKYKEREIRLKGEKRVMLFADKTLIELVLENLIENALKYSRHEVTVVIERNTIEVIDKGVGIRDDDLDKVTKKFYRSQEHTWNNSMGLGLTIVKKILTLHDMVLEIESQEGVGSTFKICFSEKSKDDIK